MQQQQIKPEKITKPIQLLAAWLIGLLLIESALLTASGTVSEPSWLPAMYGITAVLIIPLFLILIFLLQTRYRPEMQEDSFYSKYLDRNTMTYVEIDQNNSSEIKFEDLRQEIEKVSQTNKARLEEIKALFENETTTSDKQETSKKINSLISESENKIDELKKIAKFSSLNLKVNNTLPQFDEVIESIKEIGFTSYNEFGHKTISNPFIVSFGIKVPFDIAKELIFQLLPIGAGMIKLAKETNEQKNVNTIYIGSYATNSDLIRIDEKLIDELNDNDYSTIGEFIK